MARQIIDRLQGDSRDISVQFIDQLSVTRARAFDGNERAFGTHYDKDSGILFWDPRAGHATTCGGTQSPAIALLHELGHADVNLNSRIYSQQDVANYVNHSMDPDWERWGPAEERRNILNTEKTAVEELGEDSRVDHHGTPYRACGVISREACMNGSDYYGKN